MKTNEEKVGIYNPLKYDFKVNYDIKGTGKPEQFIAYSQEISYFEPVVAKHIKKHLIDAIMNERDLNPIIEKNRTDIIDEISVKI